MLRKANYFFGSKNRETNRNASTNSFTAISSCFFTVAHLNKQYNEFNLILPDEYTFFIINHPASNSGTYLKQVKIKYVVYLFLYQKVQSQLWNLKEVQHK